MWSHVPVFIFARLALPPVGACRVELSLLYVAVRDREMTLWYFPALLVEQGILNVM